MYSPREVLSESYVFGLIQDEQMWLKMLKDRNLTNYSYGESIADEIFANLENYLPVIKASFEELNSKYLK